MKEHKKKILELFKNGLKAKEISEKINVEYVIVRNIVKLEQHRIRRAKDPQKFRDSANRRYPRYAEKAIARSTKRYEDKKDEISAQTKLDRKLHPGKYRLKHQKEKEKDPAGFKAKKNANWAKNYPKNKARLSKKGVKDRRNKKQLVFSHYSKELSNSDVPCCNCCGYTGTEFLTVDHIIPKREMEKKVRSLVRSISENVSLTPKEIAMGFKAKRKSDPLNQWLITNNFPKGFQILCWNCNFAKGSPAVSFKCPHQNMHKNG